MLRLVALVLIIVGFLIFLGNLTGWWPTIPGLGVGMCVLGVLLLRYDQTANAFTAGIEDWR